MNRQIDLDQVNKRTSGGRRKRIAVILIILVVLSLIGGAFFALSKLSFVQVLLSPISFVARLVNPVQLKEEDGRVNALVLGLDTRASGALRNTDTILIGSISATEGDPALISIPRDFWLNLAPYCAPFKINSAYSCGGTQKNGSFDEDKGIAFAKGKIEEVLGIKIPYWVVVDFSGFKDIIDTLGGIQVCVDTAFSDYSYPNAGHEADPIISHRYKILHFKKGCQMMDGETALEYARSRKGTNGEGSDFARVRRQQKVITAVKDKVFSLNLLLNPGKLVKLYQQFSAVVKTNVGLGEIQRLLEVVGRLGDVSKARSLVLDPVSGLVYHPSDALYGGYVIIPSGGSGFSKIHQAVQKLLFGAKTKPVSSQGGKQ